MNPTDDEIIMLAPNRIRRILTVIVFMSSTLINSGSQVAFFSTCADGG